LLLYTNTPAFGVFCLMAPSWERRTNVFPH
jgi:hypothetical protein